MLGLKLYLHRDILPEKLLKIEQASEKSSCKLGIFLCHIVRPLTQSNCLDIEHRLFSQASGTLQGHFSGMLMVFAYIFVDLLEGKGESPRVFYITRKVIQQLFIYMVLILPGKSPCVFCTTKKVIQQIFIEQAIHMSPCKSGFRRKLGLQKLLFPSPSVNVSTL